MKTSLEKPDRTLTATDLCDRCAAPAVVETALRKGGSLLWCEHHFTRFQKALTTFGASILADERRR